ncbi:MAG: 16S rRNA (cytosine(1402)-N(4))-methyltransferase RsmH [Crocinitomicaceae bacterium]|nr:16S rRNA (cytosine(1402)-N(4))-methyltransferase RsmH [Crocinitomicaceae bacterium]MDC1385571.1 16S rRNA (cytosine(1402)-N(4))-methyltransferase RsmH [Crocinitomicaceae bacterium]|tara:strand:+ start:7762 stop:8679 length:918 start_codon:yes stop_codon:yes gene_type:complete
MTANKPDYHVPVMLQECIDALEIKADGVYIDVTFGGGGHSQEIFKKLNAKGRLIVFDQDPDARKNAWEAPNFDFVAANFAYISNHLRLLGVEKVDGILADLGVSSHQFDKEDRGFSIRGEANLDMRMNQNGELTAKIVVNGYSEEELLRIFKAYGEVSNAWKLVNAIVNARLNGKIKTTQGLLDIITPCAPKFKEHKYFAQVFQAIRIEVNDEMGVLQGFLEATEEVLSPKGRLVVMSYHSLEDRMVKNYMKRGAISGKIEKDFFGNVLKPFDEIVRHPIVANEEELERNSRARSAKLRIAERNG